MMKSRKYSFEPSNSYNTVRGWGGEISIEVSENEADCQETISNPVNLDKFLHCKTWSAKLNFPEPLFSV